MNHDLFIYICSNRKLEQWYTQMNTHIAPPHAGPIALQIDCNVMDIPLAAPL